MITAIPEGGLCNRMRVIASARLLAKAAGTGLLVKWYRTPDLNCSFADLFMPSPLFQVDEADQMNKLSKAVARVGEKAARLSGRAWLGAAETAPGKFDADAAASLARSSDLTIRTNSRLMVEEGMYQCFQPSALIESMLLPYQTRLRHSVGVHIRRADNVQAIEFSPLSQFLNLMRQELERDPDTHFFVATDSKETFAEVKSEFGERVFEHAKASYERDDPAAIKDAAVDLYALSRTRRLIGSYWSSFTDTAWEISGIDHVIVKTA